MKKYEMAESDSVEDIVKASQKALITSIKGFFKYVKKEHNCTVMTFEQIEHVLTVFENKKADIIIQDEVL